MYKYMKSNTYESNLHIPSTRHIDNNTKQLLHTKVFLRLMWFEIVYKFETTTVFLQSPSSR